MNEDGTFSGASFQPKVSAMEKAMRLLAVRGYAEAELFQRLCRGGYPAADAREAVDNCKRHGYINDSLFAADKAAMLRMRGKGGRAVRYELLKSRIDPELVAETMAAEEPGADLEAARRAMQGKAALLKRETDPRKRREKLLRFMASRGFSADTARKVMKEMESAMAGEDDDI